MHILESIIPLKPRSVQSDIPVRKLFQEVEHFWNNCIKLVLVHFLSDQFDKVLATIDNPPIHRIGKNVHIFRKLFIKDKVIVLLVFPSANVLDQESIGIVPWEENFPNDPFHPFFLEV